MDEAGSRCPVCGRLEAPRWAHGVAALLFGLVVALVALLVVLAGVLLCRAVA